MAFRRALSTRATIVARQCHPWISHVLHDDADRKTLSDGNRNIADEASSLNSTNFSRNRLLSDRARQLGFGFPSYYSPAGFASRRFMSTTVDDGSEKFGIIGDYVEVLSDPAVQSAVAAQIPPANEVAIAAADSFLPVMMLQHVIDAVHYYAGLNWWAAIVLTTFLIRASTIPLLIGTLKSTTKLSIIRPRMEELKNQMQDGTLNTYEGQREMTKLFKEHGVSPFSPLKGLFIQGPIFVSFFLAIRNMAEKVPSFQHGGAYWFVDLTTPDALYILPVLTGLTFLITVESNMQEGLEGNPIAGTMKKISRVFAIVTVPLTMGFPKALFCYWITSNIFSLGYGLVMKRPATKKFLGIPDIPIEPNTGPTPTFSSFFSDMRKQAEKMAQQHARGEMAQMVSEAKKQAVEKVAQQKTQISSQSSNSSSSAEKVTQQKTQISSQSSHSSSSAVLSQRLKSLEKQVKGKKKNIKKR